MPWSDLWGPVGTLFGFIGIVLATVFYLRSRREKQILFMQRCSEVVSPQQSVEGLSIQYLATPVERLSITDFVVWNNGKETINRSDFVGGDQLRWVIPDGVRVLDVAKPPITARDAIGFSHTAIPREGNELVNGLDIGIIFEFLDRGDGGRLRIFHDGAASTEFSIAATIKGHKRSLDDIGVWIPKYKKKRGRIVWSVLMAMVYLSSIIIVVSGLLKMTIFLFAGGILFATSSAFVVLYSELVWRSIPLALKGIRVPDELLDKS